MAIAAQAANYVWQKAKISLDTLAASPAARAAFRELKTQLAGVKGNPDLQFIPVTAAQMIANGGYCPDVDACRLYGAYFKGARTSGTTAAFVAIHDATDNSATTTTVLTGKLKVTGEEVTFVSQFGWGIATDITVACATAVGGATESSVGDAANGFLIIADE